jgi:hypothetical protein
MQEQLNPCIRIFEGMLLCEGRIDGGLKGKEH